MNPESLSILNVYLHVENQVNLLIPSRDIADQELLFFGWVTLFVSQSFPKH